MLDHKAIEEHEHEHEHEMRDLSDEELASVSGGIATWGPCNCPRHNPPPAETF